MTAATQARSAFYEAKYRVNAARRAKRKPAGAAGNAAARRWWWALPESVVAHPRVAVGLSFALPMLTVITVSEVVATWLAGCCALGFVLSRRGANRVLFASLQDTAKFRKRKRAVKARFAEAFDHAGLRRSNRLDAKRPILPRLRRVERTPLGVRLIINGTPASIGAGRVREAAPDLTASFNARSLTVPSIEGSAAIAVNLRFDTSPFFGLRPVRVASKVGGHWVGDLPPQFGLRPTQAYSMISEDNEPVITDVRLPQLAIGDMGSGKSTLAWTTLYQLAVRNVPIRLRVFDPSGGMELGELEHVAYQYETNPAKWGAFLANYGRALQGRMAALREQRVRELLHFDEENPLDLLLIDELVTALMFNDQKVTYAGQQMTADRAMKAMFTTIRKAGFGVMAATVIGQKDTIGTIRSIFSSRVVLRLQDRDMIRNLIGDPNLYPADELPERRELAGQAFRRVDGVGIEKVRVALLTDSQRAAVPRMIGRWTEAFNKTRGE